MDKTFISKHKFGIVALLFFILLVSQEKSLRFLIHTILGRLSLIILLLAISNFNIVYGIAAVLFIVIMTNKDNYYYLEAFNPEQKDTLNLTDEQKSNLDKIKQNLEAKKNQLDTIASSSVSAATSSSVTDTFVGGREGYNTMERERNMQLGKKSNEVSVGNTNQNTENVQPYDENMLSSTPTNM